MFNFCLDSSLLSFLITVFPYRSTAAYWCVWTGNDLQRWRTPSSRTGRNRWCSTNTGRAVHERSLRVKYVCVCVFPKNIPSFSVSDCNNNIIFHVCALFHLCRRTTGVLEEVARIVCVQWKQLDGTERREKNGVI